MICDMNSFPASVIQMEILPHWCLRTKIIYDDKHGNIEQENPPFALWQEELHVQPNLASSSCMALMHHSIHSLLPISNLCLYWPSPQQAASLVAASPTHFWPCNYTEALNKRCNSCQQKIPALDLTYGSSIFAISLNCLTFTSLSRE